MRFGDAFDTPWWLHGGHAQTILPARFTRHRRIAFRRERWTTPDGDFIDLDWTTHATAPDAPLVVMFHGLEGDSRSHYAQTLMVALRERGWRGVIPHFRGCSGELNQAPRFYHSGDSAEIRWVLQRLRDRIARETPRTPMLAVGISLGGNALLRYLGEDGHGASFLRAAAAISAPLDLAAGGAALSRGFNMVYTRMFLQTLKRKSLAKLDQFPGLFDREAMMASRDLYAFDNIVTAPLHGFRDTDDYWARAASKPILGEIRIPTLVLNARNDPFLPARHLPGPADVSSDVLLEQPATGGHVGFMTPRGGLLGQLPLFPVAGHIEWLPARILAFFDSIAKDHAEAGGIQAERAET